MAEVFVGAIVPVDSLGMLQFLDVRRMDCEPQRELLQGRTKWSKAFSAAFSAGLAPSSILLLLVVMPLLLVAFLLLVVRPGATSSVLLMGFFQVSCGDGSIPNPLWCGHTSSLASNDPEIGYLATMLPHSSILYGHV